MKKLLSLLAIPTRFIILFLVGMGVLSFQVSSAFAQRNASVKTVRSIVYHGKIVAPDGKAISGNFNIDISIFSPEPELCLLWAERQAVKVKDGGFSMELGYDSNRLSGPDGGVAQSFPQTFVNNSALRLEGARCATTSTYTSGTSDDRLLQAIFTNIEKPAEKIELFNLPLKAVPYALQAEQISGFGLANLAKVSGEGTSVTYTPEEVQSLKDFLGGNIFWDMKSRTITNVADPVNASDAVNRGWVLSQITSSHNGGTVTSVGLTAPSIFGVSGGPITTNGSLSLSLINQNANSIFAGPSSGGAAPPVFRNLVEGDIPNLSASKITTGVLSFDRGGTGLVPTGGDANKVFGVNSFGNGTEFKAITAGSGVSILHGAGSVQISATGSGGTVTSVSGNAPLFVLNGSSSPTISISQATNSTNGYLSSGDWVLFNGKQESSVELSGISNILSTGILQRTGSGTYITLGTSSPIGVTAGNLTISQANGTTSGFLSNTDWTAFNNKISSELDPKIGVNTTNYVPKWNGSALVSTGLIEIGGNIGVGAVSPGFKLDVVGDVNVTGNFKVNGTNINSGTVTSITTGAGLTGGPISTSGSIALATIANNSVLANTIGSAAAPVATTVSALVDSAIGSTQGSILYRNATGWVILPPGNSGEVLKTQGSGANPFWSGDANSGGTLTALSGDVNASGTGSVSATVASVGGVTAANVASGANLANASTSANTASAIVRRDSAGNFSAGTISATSISGSASSISSSAIDFANGNSVTTSYDCAGGDLTLANIKNGGSYIVVVTSASTAPCTFGTTVTGVDAGTVAYRYSIPNGARLASSHSLYSLTRVGNTIYISWSTGFQ